MRKFLSLFIVVVLLNVGCRKDTADYFVSYSNNQLNDTAWNNNLTANAVSNTLFQSFSLSPFVDSFDISSSALFRISPQLELNVPAASLQDKYGTHFNSGIARLEFRYIKSKGDYIRYARPTTTYGKLMESLFAMEVRFFSQNVELYMQPGKKLFFTIKDPNTVSGMNVYFGNMQPQGPLPFGTNPFFVWTPANDSSFITPFIRHDSTGTIKGYQLFAGKTNWINCMKTIDTSVNKTNINIILPLNFTNNNTAVFAIFKDGKSIVQLNGDIASRTFVAPNFPMGEEVMFVTLSKIGNQFYLGFKEVDINQNFILTISPVAKSVDSINQFLNSL